MLQLYVTLCILFVITECWQWPESLFDVASTMTIPYPLRELAAKRRDALLLYEFSRDAAGLPIPGTQRRFKLTANPRQIGQESVGLGVYLTTIILYMGIMLLLALLSIYLIVDNSKQAGYTETYTAFVNNVRPCVDWKQSPLQVSDCSVLRHVARMELPQLIMCSTCHEIDTLFEHLQTKCDCSVSHSCQA